MKKFYELRKEYEPVVMNTAVYIKLNTEDFEKKMEVGYYIAMDKKDFEDLNVSEMLYYSTDDEPITKEQFERYEIWTNSYHMDDDYVRVLRNIEDIEDLAEEREMTIDELREDIKREILKNEVDGFECNYIHDEYWDGSNHKTLSIYDEYYDADVKAGSDGKSELEEELQNDLQTMQEVLYHQGNTSSNTLYKTKEGRYLFKFDSRYQGDFNNIFNVYEEVNEHNLEDILQEQFDGSTLEDLKKNEIDLEF